MVARHADNRKERQRPIFNPKVAGYFIEFSILLV